MLIFVIPASVQEASGILPRNCHLVHAKVNILMAADLSEQEVKDMIKDANEVLKKRPFCIKLKANVMKLGDNGPDEKLADGSSNPNNDGKISADELERFFDEGKTEANMLPGGKKRIKNLDSRW